MDKIVIYKDKVDDLFGKHRVHIFENKEGRMHLTAGNLPLVVMDMTLSSVFVIIDLSKDETEGFL